MEPLVTIRELDGRFAKLNRRLEGFATLPVSLLTQVTGALPAANGGTGLSAYGTANYIIGMNGAGAALEYKHLIEGANITITHAAGSITIAAAGGVGAHDLLSSSHGDALAAAVVAGDLMLGNATPKWSRLAKGAGTTYLAGSDAGLPSWTTLNQAAVAGLTTASSPTFVGLLLSGLSISVPVVTDGSKNLASVTYATFKSSLAIAQADVSGLTTADGPTFDHLHLTNDLFVYTNLLYVDHSVLRVGINMSPNYTLSVGGYVEAFVSADSEFGYRMQRNKGGGSYNDSWLWYMPATSKNLRLYNAAAAADILEFTTSTGLLTLAKPLTCNGTVSATAGFNIADPAGPVAHDIKNQSGSHYSYLSWSYGSTRGCYMGWGTPGTYFDMVMEDNNYLNITGQVKMASYGAGTATFSAAGLISSVSDMRLKNLRGKLKAGLNAVINISPILFSWKGEVKGQDYETIEVGFSAQEVQKYIPETVGYGPDGYLTLSDRGLIGATINAIKELNEENIRLRKRLENLESGERL